MITKELISSYNEKNDTFVCKLSDKNGYVANYDISNGIFLSTDINNLPVSFFIGDASNVLNVNKSILENPKVSIYLKCSKEEIDFELFIADKRIYSSKSGNYFNIPDIDCEIKADWGV